MAKIEYSRLLIKRTDIGGVVPTIPTGSSIPNDSWNDTDIMVGELFSNVADDRMWIRTENGITELPLSGFSSQNYFTTGATLVGSTLVFDRNDALSAYTVDLSTLAPTGGTGGAFLPLNITAATVVNFSEDLLFSGTGSFTDFDIKFQGGISYSSYNFNLVQNSFEISDGTNKTYYTQSANNITLKNDSEAGGEATSFSLGNRAFSVSSEWSGFTGILYLDDYSANYTNRSLVDKGYVDSAIPTTVPYDFSFAASDEDTVLATGTSVATLYVPRNFTVTKVKVSLSKVGSNLTTVDVNVNGTSILSSPINLTTGSFINSTTSLVTSALTENDMITVDIDLAGTGAKGLKVYLIGNSTL